MRLSRNRVWGHPALVAFIERLAIGARDDGWPGLLVGDMAQPRGGDAHRPRLAPDRARRRPLADPDAGPAAQRRGTGNDFGRLHAPARTVDETRFTDAHIALIRRASLIRRSRGSSSTRIKQALCARATGDRAWLNKVRPWWGHDAHFHVRLACPPGERRCRDQEAPPPGDGCGDDLAWWLTDEPWKPKPPGPPTPPLRLADLPAECTAVLRAR